MGVIVDAGCHSVPEPSSGEGIQSGSGGDLSGDGMFIPGMAIFCSSDWASFGAVFDSVFPVSREVPWAIARNTHTLIMKMVKTNARTSDSSCVGITPE
jgi:hypothetical protein